jgi:hypothetical protein
MTDLIKKYFLVGVILILVVLLFISRCNQPKPDPPKPTIHIDTVWSTHVDTVPGKPKLVYTEPTVVIDSFFIPDKDYEKLRKQYQDLLVLYFQRNVLKDTLKIDSLGHVYVTDTVSKNLISGRVYNYNIRHPEITKIITNYAVPKNQMYIGGSLQGNLTNPVNQINAGLMLKNKKDQLYGIYTGINMDGQLQFGLQSYWKISFRK